MKMTKIRLGDHIKRISKKNHEGKYGIDKYISVTDEKVLKPGIKPKVFTDTDPTQYKIAEFGQFVFATMVHFGKGLSGGRLYQDVGIFSSTYEVFEVDSKILDPEYLLLLMSTVEFDKHVDHRAYGTANRYFRWKDISAIHFEIPSLEDQQKVVNTFQKLNRLIDTKENLVQTIHELCHNIFRKNFCEVGRTGIFKVSDSDCEVRLADISKLQMSTQESRAKGAYKIVKNRSTEYPFPAFTNAKFQTSVHGFANTFNDLPVVVTVDNVQCAVKIRYQKSLATNQVIVINCELDKCTPEFVFHYLSNTPLLTSGTTTNRQTIVIKTLAKHKIKLPDLEKQKEFSEQVRPLLKLAEQCVYDLYELRQLRKAWLTDFRPELLAKAAV